MVCMYVVEVVVGQVSYQFLGESSAAALWFFALCRTNIHSIDLIARWWSDY